MKQYNITVNGTVYAVEVEEVGAVSAPAPAAKPAAAPAAAPAPAAKPAAAPAAAPAPAAKPAAAPSAGATVVNAPIPGTVLDVQVTPGKAVKSGEILLILEAMKMENEIMSPVDGTIDVVQVSKGDAVNAGDLLVTIK